MIAPGQLGPFLCTQDELGLVRLPDSQMRFSLRDVFANSYTIRLWGSVGMAAKRELLSSRTRVRCFLFVI